MVVTRLKALLVGVALSFYVAIPATADTDAILQYFPTAVVGDFNGDGIADALVPGRSGADTGVYLGRTGAEPQRVQDLPAGYLGLPWNDANARVYSGDFNGDGRADLLIQASTPAQHSAVLFAATDGRFDSVSVDLDPLHLGLPWSASESTLSVGDFDGNGRADVLVRSLDGSQVHTAILSDETGTPAFGPQAWQDGYLGRTWNGREVATYTGDFNGDQREDLLIQVLDDQLIDGVPGESAYALALAGPQGTFTTIDDSWGRNELGAEWSLRTHMLRVGDVDGDGIADVVLRARDPNGTNYLMLGTSRGFREVAARWTGSATARDAWEKSQDSLQDYQQMQMGKSLESPTGASKDETVSTMQAMSFTAGTPAVGAVAGEAGVSGGSASYSIPIVAPPGRAGMQPSVSLGYSSRGGNGELGMGWSLGAGSGISRCGQIAAIAGESNLGVTLTNTDRLCLDGQRLIATSGAYGSSGTVYRTELESYVRVEQSGAAFSSASSKFLVKYADGRVAYYGYDAQSVFVPANQSAPSEWLLTRLEDTATNSVIFTYDNAGGEHHLSQISYTGRGTTAGDRKVNFIWEARPDVSSAWQAGGRTEQTKRLQQVTTMVGAQTVREYRLTYRNDSEATQRSLLGSVEECAYAGATLYCLPATNFEWQAAVTSFGLPGTVTANTAGLTTSDNKAARITLGDDPQMPPLGMVTDRDIATVPQPYEVRPGASFIGAGKRELWFQSGTSFVRMLQPDIAGTSTPTGFKSIAPPSGASWPDLGLGFWEYFPELSDKYADMNNDGKTDVLNGAVLSAVVDAQGNPTSWKSNGMTLSYSGGLDVKLADFDGDGKTDVLSIVDIDPGSATDRQAKISRNTTTPTLNLADGVSYSFASAATAFDTPESTVNIGGIDYPTAARLQQVMDFDGDGRPDILYTSFQTLFEAPAGRPDKVLLNRTVGTSVSFVSVDAPHSGDPDDLFLWADLNGDGLQDFLVKGMGANGTAPWQVRMNKGGGSFGALQTPGVPGVSKLALRVGDIDNDGKDEILVPITRVATMCIKDQTFMDPEGQWVTEDLCGAALLNLSPEYAKQDASIYTYAPYRIVEAANGTLTAVDTGIRFNAPGTGFTLGDANGDGLNDIAWSVNRNVGMFYAEPTDSVQYHQPLSQCGDECAFTFPSYGNYLSKATQVAPDLMTSVSDGLGRQAQWIYAPLSSESVPVLSGNTPFYQATGGYSDDEYFYFTSTMYVVADFLTSHHGSCTGSGLANCDPTMFKRRYAYREAMYNNQGRGFQGFRTIIEDDVQRELRTTTTFHQKWPLTGRVETSKTQTFAQIGGAGYASSVANTWASAQPIDAYTTEARLTSSVADRKETDPNYAGLLIATTTTTSTYTGACTTASTETIVDQFGSRSVELLPMAAGTDYEYDAGTNWLICRPLKKTTRTSVTTSARYGEAQYTDSRDLRQTFTYNARRQVLTDSVEDPAVGAALKRTTTYTYEENTGSTAYGNLKTVSVGGGASGTYVSPRTTTTGWSADGYFPASVSNPLSQVVTTVTDPAHGQPIQVTDPNGVDAYASYDAFGRKSASWVEDLPVQSIAYALCAGCGDGGFGAYSVTTTQAGTPTTTVTYDPLNRAIESTTQGFDTSHTVYGRSRFDAAGRSTWQREPSFSAAESGSYPRTSFVYDALDRVTSTSDAKGLVTTTTFEGGITHVSAVGDGVQQTAAQETDSAGHLLTAIDAYSNKTHFRYDALGDPVRIVDGIGAIVTATYNGLGQKTALVDPDLGSWTYSYNVIGELTSQVDAKAKTSNFYYDQLGRMTDRIEPEAGGSCTTTWTYDTAQYGIGKPAMVTQCGGYYETYSYDAKGRMTNLAQVVDGYLYETSTTYDSLGRVDTLWYPLQTSIGSPTVPGAPTNVQVTPAYSTDGTLTVSWGAPAGGAAPTSYKVYKRKVPNTSWGTATTVSATTFSKTYTNMMAGEHEFKVVACASSNCSVDSQIVMAEVAGGGQLRAGGGGGVSTMSSTVRFGVKQNYNAQGYLASVQNANTNSVYWTGGGLNEYGAIQSETFGNNVVSARTFKTGTPFVDSIAASGGVQALTYQWNAFGQLINRTDTAQGLDEDFTYDLLNRVRTGSLNFPGGSVTTLDVTYNAVGNILTKLDVSGSTSYTYPAFNAARPHAVTAAWGKTYAYDNNGNMQTRGGSPLTWTVANLPKRIDSGTNYAEFRYGPSRARFQQVAKLGTRTETTTYAGSLYETAYRSDRTKQEYRYQVTAGGMPVARVTEYSDTTPDRVEYMHRDHLGSIDAVSNSSGVVPSDGRMSFDAHGSRRAANATQGNSWRQLLPYATSATTVDALREHTTRGFTDHEMLDGVGLIHMNGRVYDPALGRFMSVDPVFQFPTNTQSLNPYTYVLNSPLTMTDPTGLASSGGEPMWGEWMLATAGWSADSRGGLQRRLNEWKAQAFEFDHSDASKVGGLSRRKNDARCNEGGCRRAEGESRSGGTEELLTEVLKALQGPRPLNDEDRSSLLGNALQTAIDKLRVTVTALKDGQTLSDQETAALGFDVSAVSLLERAQATLKNLETAQSNKKSIETWDAADLRYIYLDKRPKGQSSKEKRDWDNRFEEHKRTTAWVADADSPIKQIRVNNDAFFDKSRDPGDYAETMMHEGAHFNATIGGRAIAGFGKNQEKEAAAFAKFITNKEWK